MVFPLLLLGLAFELDDAYSPIRADVPFAAVDKVELSQFKPGRMLELETASQRIRALLISPSDGTALLCIEQRSGGKSGQVTRRQYAFAYLLGAANRPNDMSLPMFIRMGKVNRGLGLEYGLGGLGREKRRFTAPIQSIRVAR